MIVPAHWAEARLQQRDRGRQVTVRRWGWSDIGPAEAQAHAEQRAREAMARIVAGESLPRRERKQAYNGADGVPIREEILARDGDAVITRNSYGARCLNVPDVLFADIDFEPDPRMGTVRRVGATLLVVAAAIGLARESWTAAAVAAFVALTLAYPLAKAWHRGRIAWRGGDERVALSRIDALLADQPQARIRVYRTPAGLRVAALHRRFDPNDAAAQAWFERLRVDPAYARMCSRQRCFRARLTAKPWRIGIAAHLRPRPGVWPVADDKRPLRERWVADYERRALGFAACRLLAERGGGPTDPLARRIVDLHDRLSGADAGRPIA